jgi:hypothetical protein
VTKLKVAADRIGNIELAGTVETQEIKLIGTGDYEALTLKVGQLL